MFYKQFCLGEFLVEIDRYNIIRSRSYFFRNDINYKLNCIILVLGE
jgi:hypothetical protein